MTRRRGWTLVELMAYLAAFTLVGGVAVSLTLSAERERRAVTALATDADQLRAAAEALGRDVRASGAPVRIEGAIVRAGDVSWTLTGRDLVRRDGTGERPVARRVAVFQTSAGADGTVRARIELLPRSAGIPQGPSIVVAARRRAAEDAR